MKWLFPEHVGERTLCRSPDSSGGAGSSLATGCWATNCKTPGVAGARPRGAWLQGGIRSPMQFRPGGNCRMSGSFSWLLPFTGLLGRAVPCCAVVSCGAASPGPRRGPARRSWPLEWVAWWGLGAGGRWCDPPGADWSHLSQTSASCSPNWFIPSSVRQTKLGATRRVFGRPLATEAGSRACVEDF